MDSDPAIFVSDLQDVNKKLFFISKYFCFLLFEGNSLDIFCTKNHYTTVVEMSVGLKECFQFNALAIFAKN